MTRHDTDERTTIEALELRLRRLESHVRLLRQGALGAAALVALGALLGAAAVIAPDVLSARSFQLVGEDGAVLGRWVASGADKTTRLEALNAGGEVVAGIAMQNAEPYVRVLGPHGKSAAGSHQLHGTPEAGAGAGAAKETDAAPAKKDGEEEEDNAFDWVQ